MIYETVEDHLQRGLVPRNLATLVQAPVCCGGLSTRPRTSSRGPTKDRGWSRARNALHEIENGDWIVVALRGNRVGRLVQVTGKAVEDKLWSPLVPPSREDQLGEMGRRVFVRWDMSTGPDDRDLVVFLPENCRFSDGERRPTLCQIDSCSVERLKAVMNDRSNWVGLVTHFDYESALQGYIAANPHRLEDGLEPHPDKKIREKVFDDRSRLDVLLIDRDGRPVIVECKQGAPSPPDVSQLRHYMKRLHREARRKPRGILVHGRAPKLSSKVRKEAAKEPRVEIVRDTLAVSFELYA